MSRGGYKQCRLSVFHCDRRMAVEERGALIVIEGLDRAGKSSQCEQLCAKLEREGHRVMRMRFPGMLHT